MQLIQQMQWGMPETVNLKNGQGQRDVRTAPATKGFWDAWNGGQKDAMKAAGLSVTKDQRTNEFVAKLWTPVGAPIPGSNGGAMTYTPSPQEKAELMQNPAINAVATPNGNYPGAEIQTVTDYSQQVPMAPAPNGPGPDVHQKLHTVITLLQEIANQLKR